MACRTVPEPFLEAEVLLIHIQTRHTYLSYGSPLDIYFRNVNSITEIWCSSPSSLLSDIFRDYCSSIWSVSALIKVARRECRLMGCGSRKNRRFRGTCRHHFQVRKIDEREKCQMIANRLQSSTFLSCVFFYPKDGGDTFLWKSVLTKSIRRHNYGTVLFIVTAVKTSNPTKLQGSWD
jgi:hypothetical protein